MTNVTYSVKDGYGYYIATDWNHAVTIATADAATSCVIYANGVKVAHKAAGAIAITKAVAA